MPLSDFDILLTRTLLYYEIFDHPLSARELFYLFPRNSMTRDEFGLLLERSESAEIIIPTSGFYQLRTAKKELGPLRKERELLAKKRMRIARFFALVIRQFPFVRGIFLSGDLSKGVAHKDSDIDYVIVTAPRRLWICRSLLVLFKKVVLFNSKKYFCLNYYVAEDAFHLEDHNYFTATEVAHLKPLYNITSFIRYVNENAWVKMYFPGFKVFALSDNEAAKRRGLLQPMAEFLFAGSWADRFDRFLMNTMRGLWSKRYPEFDIPTRERLFRCTPTESSAYVGNFADKILRLYDEKLSSARLR